MRVRLAIAFALAGLLAGCGSSPKTHYYTLSESTGAVGRLAVAHPVTVAAVHIPASLDRSQMVVHSGANQVDISGQNRWTGPLGEMSRRVLSEDLAAHLPKAMVVMPDAPAPDDVRQIVVTISSFGPDASGAVVLDADWALVDANSGKPMLRRDVHFEDGSPAAGANGVAASMSTLLGKLAGNIAQALAGGV